MNLGVNETSREASFCGWINPHSEEKAKNLAKERNGDFNDFFHECVREGLLSTGIHCFLDAILSCAPPDQRRQSALLIIEAKRLRKEDPIKSRNLLSSANCKIRQYALSWLRILYRHAQQSRQHEKLRSLEQLLDRAEKSHKAEDVLSDVLEVLLTLTLQANTFVKKKLFDFSVGVLND